LVLHEFLPSTWTVGGCSSTIASCSFSLPIFCMARVWGLDWKFLLGHGSPPERVFSRNISGQWRTYVCTAYMHFFNTANLKLYFMPASPYCLYSIGSRSCHGLRINPQPFILHFVPCSSLLPYLVKRDMSQAGFLVNPIGALSSRIRRESSWVLLPVLALILPRSRLVGVMMIYTSGIYWPLSEKNVFEFEPSRCTPI
jgi:hypothetical protein